MIVEGREHWFWRGIAIFCLVAWAIPVAFVIERLR